MIALTQSSLRRVNSVSYADLAGLQLGMERLPGEETTGFVDRLYQAAVSKRDHSYQGTINEICFHLGLEVQPGIVVNNTQAVDAHVWVTASGLHLYGPNGDTYQQWDIPLRTVQGDSLWKWRTLAEVVAAINTTPNFTAELVIDNGPALQIAQQANVFSIINETVRGARGWLQHGNVILDSVRFNYPTTMDTTAKVNLGLMASIDPSGQFAFTAEPPANFALCYQYQELPYSLVTSQVGLMGLLDPGLAPTLLDNGKLLYQVREALQEFMEQDRSYWAR